MDYNLSVSTAIIAISSCIFNLRKIEPQNPKLLELRVKSITEQKRMSRDQRKALLKEKKEKSQAEALLSAVKVTGVLCSSKPLALIARLILTLVYYYYCNPRTKKAHSSFNSFLISLRRILKSQLV